MSPVSTFPATTSQPPGSTPAVPGEIQKQVILDYLTAFGLASQLTESEKLQFIEIAQAFHLNPFKREIHVVVYGEGEYRRLSIITGYAVYLKRAERTGKLDGWRAWVEGQGEEMKACVEIHRKDWANPFVHEVYWREAVQKKRDGTPSSFWTKQPRFQLKKVAISQGFRLCFPDELGGLPYDAAELPDAETITPTTPMTPVSQAHIPALSTPVPSRPAAPEVQRPAPTSPKPVAANVQHPATVNPKPVFDEAPVASPTEPVPIRFIGYHDQYPGESRDALLKRLEAYLDDNAEAFTEKHGDWVLDKARKSQDRDGVMKMLTYAQKVVRNVSSVTGASA
jgi:phage recombination protein Bet